MKRGIIKVKEGPTNGGMWKRQTKGSVFSYAWTLVNLTWMLELLLPLRRFELLPWAPLASALPPLKCSSERFGMVCFFRKVKFFSIFESLIVKKPFEDVDIYSDHCLICVLAFSIVYWHHFNAFEHRRQANLSQQTLVVVFDSKFAAHMIFVLIVSDMVLMFTVPAHHCLVIIIQKISFFPLISSWKLFHQEIKCSHDSDVYTTSSGSMHM